MNASVLRAIHAWDRAHFRRFQRRWRHALTLTGEVSPHLRFARLRVEPGGRLEIAAGFATERQPGNHLWLGEDARIELGPRAWLRTEYGANRITAFAGAHVRVGRDALINGAMIHAKGDISIGDECRLAFGSRIFDADLHALDSQTPERIDPVKIGDRVWLGADAIVLRGVTIGDDVVVGAGAVVTRDLPSRCLALGQPARAVRDIAPRTGCS
jgi:acetyltransferase-like isoleucine patch superfamily enzyme